MSAPYYQADGVTLYHGDCRAVLPTLAPVDVVLTDPPYGVGCRYDGYTDTSAQLATLLAEAWPLVLGWGRTGVVCTPGNGNQWRYRGFRQQVAWVYRVGVVQLWQPLLVWGARRLSLVLDYTPTRYGSPADGHPCPKPLEFWAYLLKRLLEPTTNLRLPLPVIGDPFCGSGTTLLAARALGLRAVGIEQSERYCEVIAKRLQAREIPV